ncbi:BA75_05251T0 [Komagataella pastoris]|uniref:BA75_05251T0 n=1 Tax=Komagataella pastoris TaxID=4922 RepID=A0A1B2JIF0_PICPA|nr:BA75_05251T0 [Komagataella pastoris]
MLAENGDYCRTNNRKGFRNNFYNKEQLSGDLLEANLFASPIGDLILHSMPCAPIITDPEQPQEPQLKYKNQCSCHQELDMKTEDQQKLFLLPDMLSKNIFNSQPSMFVNSTVDISFDQSVQNLSSYGLNSVEETPSPECASVSLDLISNVEASTKSLEAAVNCKRQMFQLRKESRVKGLNHSGDIDVATSNFLNHSWLPLVRGRHFGASNCRPPKKPLFPGTRYVTARLRLEYSSCEDMCLPEWNEYELKDSRRIIRIERRYDSNEVVASFSIVGSAVENPETGPASNPNVRVLEVSCLKCLINDDESEEEQYVNECKSDKAQAQCDLTEQLNSCSNGELNSPNPKMARNSIGCKYYITSVEVIKIIELLIGSYSTSDRQQRRKERGRMRSNLAQFWSKHLVSSSRKTTKRCSVSTCNNDYLAGLEHRINTYDVRKPRVFDKSVKIMEWSKLGPALQRAIQSYYMVRLDESSNKIATTNSN